VNEVGVRVVAYAAAMQSESGLAQLERVDTWHAQVDGFRLNVQAVLGDSGGVSAQRFVRRRSAVAADNVNLTVGMANRRSEIEEDIV